MQMTKAKQEKHVFRIRVADRITQEETEFDISATSVHAAEKQALDAGWVVVDPSSDPIEPDPTPAPLSQEKKMERAVMFGVLKAAAIVIGALIVLTVVLNLILFSAS